MDRYQVALHKKPPLPKELWVKSCRIRNWNGFIVWQEKFPRAATFHFCEKCRAEIKKGHFYKKITLKRTPHIKAKDFTEIKICLSCAAKAQIISQLF